jgi:hypothetical protein
LIQAAGRFKEAVGTAGVDHGDDRLGPSQPKISEEEANCEGDP